MADKVFQIELGGTAVGDDFYGDLVSITAEENTSTPGALRLRLAATLQSDGKWTYFDDERLMLFKKVKLLIGFTGGGGLAGALGGLLGGNDPMEPVFEGYVTAVTTTLGSEPDSVFVEVSATDTCVLMGLEDKIATYPNLSDSDVIRQVLANYNVQALVDPTSPTHQDSDTIIVQRGTDLQLVRDLARKNGLEFYMFTDKDSGQVTASCRAPQLDGTPQPDLAIQFGASSNLGQFSARLSGLRPLNVKAEQVDVKANAANTAQAADTQLNKLGADDLNTLVGGPAGSLVTPADAPSQMLALGPPTSDATELRAIVQAVRDEAGWLIEAIGEINSEAYQAVLRSHRLVQVKGVGTAYSGKYYVTRVVHHIKTDGTYTQTFEARRNARGVDGSESFGGAGLGVSLPGV